jgi:DNA-directed RNA polymerase specialized sigma24 family protein
MATEALLHDADDATLSRLVDEHYGAMHRLARLVARDGVVARDAVTAAWAAAVRDGLPRTATTRAALLGLVLDALPATPTPAREPIAAADDFEDPDGRWAGWWKDEQASTPPLDATRLEQALATIEPRLAAVLILRDVEGSGVDDVEALLGYSREQQLALLHDGRVAVRNALRAEGSA